ncbi:MAG: hypothetical protein HC841_00115 [Verrucomicrobiae bacterium]|nr:hypothetical protein [Verrucomicrobiae bacterium]
MRILMVFAVATTLASAASDVATAYSTGTVYEHQRAERVLGEEYGERCVEYATFEECIQAFEEGA